MRAALRSPSPLAGSVLEAVVAVFPGSQPEPVRTLETTQVQVVTVPPHSQLSVHGTRHRWQGSVLLPQALLRSEIIPSSSLAALVLIINCQG